uniref:C2H2-type domain-containing protein n=1 Tax=viral metagenome TaxID=1070528 RepID=A0A6C0JA53_9ZZZZ
MNNVCNNNELSYECTYCNFKAPTKTRLKRHLTTQKHATIFEKQHSELESMNQVPQIVEEINQIKDTQLCENMDCERYPPDWDFEEDTEENYEDGQQWVKCNLCDGYFNDDGLGDILFIEEKPNNKTAECQLCGNDNDIVQMKGTGQFICGNACDEED